MTKLELRLRIAELEEEVAALKLRYQQAIKRDGRMIAKLKQPPLTTPPAGV
jgi:hypothetical protein